MSNKIPDHIDAIRLAEQHITLEGIVSAAEMQRINSLVIQVDKPISATLTFDIDEQDIVNVKGKLETQVTLQCQRCMEPFIYGIMSDFALGVVQTLDEATALPEHYEPAMAKEGTLALHDLIEDELILNLPIIPKHAPEECKVKLPSGDEDSEKGKNPFHVLAGLRTKQK